MLGNPMTHPDDLAPGSRHSGLCRVVFATLVLGLMVRGVLMERVSMLLGHSSIKITEKYYSPWVRVRQEQLEADVRRSWAPPERGMRPVA